jgi:hypothetical protein
MLHFGSFPTKGYLNESALPNAHTKERLLAHKGWLDTKFPAIRPLPFPSTMALMLNEQAQFLAP